MEYAFYHSAKALPVAVICAVLSVVGWRIAKLRGWLALAGLFGYFLTVGTVEQIDTSLKYLGALSPNEPSRSLLYSAVFVVPIAGIYFWSLIFSEELKDYLRKLDQAESANRIGFYAGISSAQLFLLVVSSWIFAGIGLPKWIILLGASPTYAEAISQSGMFVKLNAFNLWLMSWSGLLAVVCAYLYQQTKSQLRNQISGAPHESAMPGSNDFAGSSTGSPWTNVPNSNMGRANQMWWHGALHPNAEEKTDLSSEKIVPSSRENVSTSSTGKTSSPHPADLPILNEAVCGALSTFDSAASALSLAGYGPSSHAGSPDEMHFSPNTLLGLCGISGLAPLLVVAEDCKEEVSNKCISTYQKMLGESIMQLSTYDDLSAEPLLRDFHLLKELYESSDMRGEGMKEFVVKSVFLACFKVPYSSPLSIEEVERDSWPTLNIAASQIADDIYARYVTSLSTISELLEEAPEARRAYFYSPPTMSGKF